jgi:hypothetical protein
MSARLTRNVLVPGWILGFGLVLLAFPAQGVGTNLSLFAVGLVVVPGLWVAPKTWRLRLLGH